MYICIQRVSPKKTLKCCVLAVSGLEIDIFVKGSVIFQFKQFLMFLSLEICKQLVSEENILMSKIPKKKNNSQPMVLSKYSFLQSIPKVSFISFSFERDRNFQISKEMKQAAPIFCFHLHLRQLSMCRGQITRITNSLMLQNRKQL